jgi:hypothetical protein
MLYAHCGGRYFEANWTNGEYVPVGGDMFKTELPLLWSKNMIHSVAEMQTCFDVKCHPAEEGLDVHNFIKSVKAWGSGFRVSGLGVSGSGFRVQGSGFRV